MARKQTRRLTTPELGAIAEASLLNSLRLLDDAEVLARNGRWPRCFALAVLAGEEFGKVMMCLGALGNPRADEDGYWQEFWRRFTDHKPKYENIFSMASTFIEDDNVVKELHQQVGDHVKADQSRKMAAFYVDYSDEGLSLPWVRVNEDDADAILTVFGTVIHSWVDGNGGPHIAERFIEVEAAAREFQEARASGDQDAVAAVLQRQFGVDES